MPGPTSSPHPVALLDKWRGFGYADYPTHSNPLGEQACGLCPSACSFSVENKKN